MQKQKIQQPRRKKVRFKPRFYTIIATFLIVLIIIIFLWRSGSNRIPNLHGWESSAVLDFVRANNINVEFEFIYSSEVAPTLVINQSVTPGTSIHEVSTLIIQVSKGIEVR